MTFNPKRLTIGTEVELEHTSDRLLAAKIAKDHLQEDPDYYSKLDIVENRPWILTIGQAAIPLGSEKPGWIIFALLGSAVSGYHGWKRNGTVTMAVGWAAAGVVSPLLTTAVAFAQGFAKKN